MSPRQVALLAASAALALLAPVAIAATRSYDIPASLGDTLASTKAETPLTILLPSRMVFDYDKRVYPSGGGDRTSWGMSLTTRASCGANACFVATFRAERGEAPAFVRKVALRGGRTGYFKPLSCGGSCSPPIIQWRSRGNLYSIQAGIPDRTVAGQIRRMVAAANSAIGAGPR